MNTLLVPCAGRSSRFPNMRPKWLLTHPDGHLMLQKAISGFDLAVFDRIIFTIVRPHAEQFQAELILQQAFCKFKNIEVCVLDDFTNSASETIACTLRRMHVEGSFVVKDSDNYVSFAMPSCIYNAVVGIDIDIHRDVTHLPEKSFLMLNEQGIIQDIVEKHVVSNYICLGVYIFDDSQKFLSAYDAMSKIDSNGEMYLSHVMAYMIANMKEPFKIIFAREYEDFGTFENWRSIQKQHSAYFVDFDGVLMKNSGQYGAVNWSNNFVALDDNVATLRLLQQRGAQIIICTSRPEEYRSSLEKFLSDVGIVPHAIVMGINHAPRILINDFAPTLPYPSATSISLPRNGSLGDWIHD